MAAGDVVGVDGCAGVSHVDTGMYGTAGYGSVYLVDGDRPAVVDTGIGTNVERVLAALEEAGVDRDAPLAVCLTHVHLDHAGGAGFITEAYPAAEVYVHEIGAPHVVDPSRLVEGTKRAVGDEWRHYVEPAPVPEDRVTALTDGEAVDLGDRRLVAHHAPGHAPHQMVYHDHLTDAVYTADAAGIWVPALGRVRETSPPPNFDLEGCLADVETIRALDPEHLLYPHFGPAPREALETYPEVLRSWVERVETAVAEHGAVEAAADALAEAAAAEVGSVWGPAKARGETRMNVHGVAHHLGLDGDPEGDPDTDTDAGTA